MGLFCVPTAAARVRAAVHGRDQTRDVLPYAPPHFVLCRESRCLAADDNAESQHCPRLGSMILVTDPHPKRNDLEMRVSSQRRGRYFKILPSSPRVITKIAQGWPELSIRAKFRPPIGILSQNTGPSRAIRASPILYMELTLVRAVAMPFSETTRRWSGIVESDPSGVCAPTRSTPA